jgi:hypothetical protein
LRIKFKGVEFKVRVQGTGFKVYSHSRTGGV